ncbi:MAG: AAA family ATPase [Myxococcota bacterium]
MTIVLVGMHGAGKTTIGRALATRLRVPFHEEVGRVLAETIRPPERTAADCWVAVDEAVFDAELARDAAWAPGAPRVVETWHPGNLAYAARRSPLLASRKLGEVRAALVRHPAVVLPVRVPSALAAARQHERGELDFFAAVGLEAEGWAARLGLCLLPPVVNDGSVEDAVAAALEFLTTRAPVAHRLELA